MFIGTVILTSALLQSQLKTHPQTFYVTEETKKAWVTKYTEKESCTNARCINASGYHPIAGKSVACPRKYPLGTKIKIGDILYTCDDRYASWVQTKFGDTFDIFSTSYEGAIRWGRRMEIITILYEKS